MRYMMVSLINQTKSRIITESSMGNIVTTKFLRGTNSKMILFLALLLVSSSVLSYRMLPGISTSIYQRSSALMKRTDNVDRIEEDSHKFQKGNFVGLKMADLNKKILDLENEIEEYRLEMKNATSPQEKSELRGLIKSRGDNLTELLKQQVEPMKGK